LQTGQPVILADSLDAAEQAKTKAKSEAQAA